MCLLFIHRSDSTTMGDSAGGYTSVLGWGSSLAKKKVHKFRVALSDSFALMS